MREKAGRAPEELDAGLVLGSLQLVRDGVEGVVGRLQIVQLRRDVAIVKAVVFDAAFLHELEHGPDSLLCVLDGIGSIVPRALGGRAAERIGESVAHRMPVGAAETEVFLHRLPPDDLVRVVVLESQGVPRLGAFEGDGRNTGEKFVAHRRGVWRD